MALSASRLKTAVKAAVDAEVSSTEITNDAVILAICTAIIDEIQDNFVVSDFDVHTHGGVTSGGASTAVPD